MSTAHQLVSVNGGTSEIEKTINWTSFLKQLHISSGIWSLFFVSGLGAGAPTVFIPQMRNQSNSTPVDEEIASWLYTLSNLSAIPWVFILPIFSQRFGRKIPFIAACVTVLTWNAVLYFSYEPYQMLLAMAIQGLANSINSCIMVLIIPEYCTRNYRTVFLNIQSSSFYWGMWASNAIGTFFNWKYIPILGFLSTIYTMTISFIPESPHWLASRRKFEESKRAYITICGSNRESEKEISDLIQFYTDCKSKRKSEMNCWSTVAETARRPEFYMPLTLSILLGAQYNFSGKFVCSIYVIDIMKKVTGCEHSAYTSMLILDGVTIFGMYIGSILSKVLKMRTLYFSLSFLGIGAMFVISAYLYLSKLGIVNENNTISLCLLIVYSLSMSCGPATVSMAVYSELIPLRYQAACYTISAFVFLISCTGIVKFSPLLFNELGIHGTFLFFGITCFVLTCLLYVYLPETKGKTLIEIEQCFRDKTVAETEALTR